MAQPTITRPGALVALCLLAPIAAAQPAAPQVQPLDNIVVTPSRLAQPEDQALGDITVIRSEELGRAGQSSLAEVLSRHHGIEFNTNGGPQTVTGVNIRGAGTTHTLVLLDGVPINSAASGMGSLNALPVSSIERIEILRGAASSLYGANALGGVINIITQPTASEGMQAHATVGAGSESTFKSSAALSGRQGNWTYSLGAGFERSHGRDATTPDNFVHNPDTDGYRSTHLRGSLGYTWAPGHELRLQAYRSHTNGGIDYSPRIGADDRSVTTLESIGISSRNRLAAAWDSTVRYTYTLDRNDTRSEGDTTEFSTRQHQFSWENTLQLAQDQTLVLAYEHLQQRVSGDIGSWDFTTGAPGPIVNYDQTRRHTNAFTGIYNGRFDRHHVQASLRHDRNSQYGNETTWGLRYAFDLTDKLRVHAAANTGFLAPKFDYLYYPGMSNPDLKPEKSRNIEAGLDYTDGGLNLGLVVYQNKIRNLISAPAPTYLPVNIERATLRGVTLKGRYQFNASTAVWASADFQDPRNNALDKRLERRARQILRIGAEHRIGQWRMGTDYIHVGKRYNDAANTRELDAYGLWNLTMGYDFNANLSANLRWNNVLDKKYTTTTAYRMPRSNVFAELAWRM